ncbi:MAG TPA: ATP-dependent helicase HrpB [Dongiaceae bacterium]
MINNPFPIDASIPEIISALDTVPNLVLAAPPGAGKTTRIPPALLSCSWRMEGKIVLLQPRRLAARAAAQRMADLRNERVGETVGYRVRLDRKIGPMTRIECVTTGLFLRQIQGDPELAGIAAVLFDEFHERSLDGDLALAFALEAQASLRPDLRLMVMSATLDTERVAGLMPGARRLVSAGRSFPVETRHVGEAGRGRMDARIEDRVAGVVLHALDENSGDCLVFLPGLAEIRRLHASLEARLPADSAAILSLHGDLPVSDQDLALKPDPRGRRKVVLATSIAETSLTIDGVRIVIDSGEKRLPQFDPASGMTRLMTGRVSLAAADQRRGRAGRTAPGICYRMWNAAEERALAVYDLPEILAADLTPFTLELAIWGTTESGALHLLDQPPQASSGEARELLRRLNAIDHSGHATAHGRAMAELGVHPRLAHMMLTAQQRGSGALACDVAALLSERDLVRQSRDDADLRHRIDLLHSGRNGEADRGARDRVKRSAENWRRQLGVAADRDPDRNAIGAIVALAYPDRLAQQRGGRGQYRLSNGKGAKLTEADPLSAERFLAVASLDGDRREARVFLAAPITLAEIGTDFAAAIETAETIAWNPRLESVEAKTERRLWSLVLEERPAKAPSSETVMRAMFDGIRQMGLQALPWSSETEALRTRIAFMRHAEGGDQWPDMSDTALLENLDWLAPALEGVTRRAHLGRIDLMAALLAQLDWRRRRTLDEQAPTHLTVPSGSRLPVDYTDPSSPVLAVRLQEMFGAAETPRIAGGKVQVLLHLLSPARRPLQVTRDLRSFWQNGYAAVRADMRGQYPKHHWPEDPLQAEPTARAKPRPR